MRILIVRSWPSYMDVRNNTYNIQEVGLAKALVKKGHICDILFWTDKEEEIVSLSVYGREITVYYRKALTILKNALFINSKDLYEKYDIIQTSEYNQFESLWLSWKYPTKTVVYHGPYYSRFNKKYNCFCKVLDIFFLWIYKRTKTRFITKSLLAKEYLMSKGIKEGQIENIGVGIDTDMLMCTDYEETNKVYSKMIQDTNIFKLLYVGRLEPRRDIIYILDIVKGVFEKNRNIKLYVIGNGEEKYVKEVVEYARKNGLSEIIVWQKTIEQRYLGKIYEKADVLLLPTEYEIFGMVLLEAMYYKTVVLTTHNGGSSTLIKDGVNGYIMEKDNIGVWVNKIEELISNEKIICDLKNNANSTVENNYTWDSLSESFISVYCQLKMENK